MNINNIIGKLNSENLNLRLYFTKKRGSKYFSYSPSVEEELQNTLIGLIKEFIGKYSETEQVDFSPIGYREETIEICRCNYIGQYEDIIDSFNEDNLNREPINDDDINKLNFYCLECTYVEGDAVKKIQFFRRVTKFKRLSSNGFFGCIKDNRFTKIEQNLLGLDGDIDVIVYNEEVLILNHISLERIFSISDQYTEKATTVLHTIRQANRINNFDQFENDCLNDGRVTRTLTKLLGEEDLLQNCFRNFDNVVNVVSLFELSIDIDNSSDVGMIIYDNKNQLMDIIRLVRDSYYQSFIHERMGIDDGI
ncbi:MAG: Kiwa anti-phage protein KwaB-like domain-containing protein [Eubacteriaceae bacterium]